MADLRLMSREFLSDFIDLYRKNECLWKIKSKEYSDKNKKNAAYTILIEKLKEVDSAANKDMVIKKINSLRTCFRKELKKYKNSLTSGSGTEDIHKPNLWYFDLLLFLSDQETPRQDVMDTIEESIASPDNKVRIWDMIVKKLLFVMANLLLLLKLERRPSKIYLFLIGAIFARNITYRVRIKCQRTVDYLRKCFIQKFYLGLL